MMGHGDFIQLLLPLLLMEKGIPLPVGHSLRAFSRFPDLSRNVAPPHGQRQLPKSALLLDKLHIPQGLRPTDAMLKMQSHQGESQPGRQILQNMQEDHGIDAAAHGHADAFPRQNQSVLLYRFFNFIPYHCTFLHFTHHIVPGLFIFYKAKHMKVLLIFVLGGRPHSPIKILFGVLFVPAR